MHPIVIIEHVRETTFQSYSKKKSTKYQSKFVEIDAPVLYKSTL